MASQDPMLTFESQDFYNNYPNTNTTSSEDAGMDLFIDNTNASGERNELTEAEHFDEEMEVNVTFPTFFTACDGVGGRFIVKKLSETVKAGSTKPYLGKNLAKYNWHTLKDLQRKYVLKIFKEKIPEALQQELTIGAEAEVAKAYATISEQERERVSRPGGETQTVTTNTNTNLHDIARLLHVWHDPHNQGLVSQTFNLMSREELDDKANRDSAWTQLLNNFNNYDEHIYLNCTCIPAGVVNGEIKYRAKPEMEYAFELLRHVNPTSPNRPERNILWMKQHLQAFKARFTTHHENYSRSGMI